METEVETREDFSEYNGEGTTLRKAQMRMLEMMVDFDRICRKHDIPYFISGGTCLGAVRHGGFIPWDDDVDIDVWHTDYKKLMHILPKELPDKYFLQTPKTDKYFYRMFMKIVDKHSLVVYQNGEFRREKITHKGLTVDIFPLNRVLSYRLEKFIDRYYGGAFQKIRIGGEDGYKTVLAFLIWPFVKTLAKILSLLSVFAPKEQVSHTHGTLLNPELKYSNIFPPKPILFEGEYLLGPAKPREYLKDLYGDYTALPPESERKVHAGEIEVY